MGSIKGREIKIELSVVSDVTDFINKGWDYVMKGNDLIKQANLQFTLAENSFNKGVENSDKGIGIKKQLGEDSKWFDQHKQMAKDGIVKSNKGKSINVV